MTPSSRGSSDWARLFLFQAVKIKALAFHPGSLEAQLLHYPGQTAVLSALRNPSPSVSPFLFPLKASRGGAGLAWPEMHPSRSLARSSMGWGSNFPRALERFRLGFHGNFTELTLNRCLEDWIYLKEKDRVGIPRPGKYRKVYWKFFGSSKERRESGAIRPTVGSRLFTFRTEASAPALPSSESEK